MEKHQRLLHASGCIDLHAPALLIFMLLVTLIVMQFYRKSQWITCFKVCHSGPITRALEVFVVFVVFVVWGLVVQLGVTNGLTGV